MHFLSYRKRLNLDIILYQPMQKYINLCILINANKNVKRYSQPNTKYWGLVAHRVRWLLAKSGI